MDKKVLQQGNPQEEGPKRIKKKTMQRRWLWLSLVALAVAAVVTVAVLWDSTTFDGLRRAVIYAAAEKDETGCAQLYRYASEKDSVYASVGSSLIQATERRILLLGEDGQTRYNQDVKFRRAAIAEGGALAAVYDIGGSEIYLLDTAGLVRKIQAEGEVFACTINAEGAMAVTLRKSGSKATVVVYNEKGEKVFGFNSADRFLMTSALSEDGKQMAAVAMGQSEGTFASYLVLYALDSTEPVAECALPGGAVYDLAMVNGRWCAVGEDGIHFVTTAGERAAYYDFEGTYLRRCSLQGRDSVTLLLGRYKSGAQTQLVSVDTDGVQLAIQDVDREVLSITAADKYAAVLYSDELAIYERTLEAYARLENVSTAKMALMRPDGSAVLVGADAASLYLP